MSRRNNTPPKHSSDFERAVGALNAVYFFREFTFSTNTFKPSPTEELELADKVVWLGDILILSQIKERNAPPDTTALKEQSWFKEEVVKTATRQIRNTLSYLRRYPEIKVRNNRRHVFNIASAKATKQHKLVIYNPHPLLPDGCAEKKFHRSRTAGVTIHFVHAASYHEILKTLVTPIEISDYLTFREALIDKWGDRLSSVSEKALVGQFLRNLPEAVPGPMFEAYVDGLEQELDDWDIAKLIHLFPARRTMPQTRRRTKNGYMILQELAKMYRSDMKVFKKRFKFSMDKALAGETCGPNRFTVSTGCGFVFLPLGAEHVERRKDYLVAVTELNKYDQKLDKCVGLSFVSEGSSGWCDVQWYPLFFPWKTNARLQKKLQTSSPFRPVSVHKIERYRLEGLP